MKKEKEESKLSDIKLHENGIWYKEIKVNGFDKPMKLFNTLKPERLDGETFMEYKIRRILEKANNKQELFHNSKKLGTYINKNK